MNQQQKHQMNLVQTHSSGVEEWRCPQCDHRFVMQWDPYKKLILEEGDSYSLHSARKGDLQIQMTEVQHKSESEDTTFLSDELRSALDDFLKDMDFGD
ncbi:MAG: hypothetical protein IAF02_15640 [Anaerolineae bacterium]|nr:hypothetical protein [Anaerolineae bacterium]